MKLTFKKIREILGENFWIPSFQRGYRWTDVHIENLLNDLAENKTENNQIAYSLQPLVVKKESTRFSVIDGQQRLTTIYLILKALGEKEIYTIEYEDHPENSTFFAKLEDSDSATDSYPCPDFYYISQAYKVIKNWLNQHSGSLIVNDILDHAQFIWYQTEDDSYDVFCRLNTGKIALCNAELVKALILTASPLTRDYSLYKGYKQLFSWDGIDVLSAEIAAEWDFMEQTLHDDNFWYFINPDAGNVRYAASRIDYVLELFMRQEGTYNPKKIQMNPSCLFDEIEKKKHPLESWQKIRNIFRRLSSWYEDRDLYHLIGCLMNRKHNAENRISDLVSILNESMRPHQTTSEFKENLFHKVKDTFLSAKINGLNYEKNRNQLNDVLLLFNIALLNRQKSIQSRYPFADHQKTKWSLEHIHAKNERALAEEDIRKISEISLGKDYFEEDTLEDLICKFNTKNKPLLEIVSREKEWFLNDSEEVTHGLENLALLNCSNNSAFNNALFMEKRALLAQWEGCEGGPYSEESSFVPLGTKMVFFKHFSPHSSVPYLWTSEDGSLYLASIKKYLATYLGCNENEL